MRHRQNESEWYHGRINQHPPLELARRVYDAWINFARTGNPGWASYNLQERPVMRIGTSWEILTNLRPVERQAWNEAR